MVYALHKPADPFPEAPPHPAADGIPFSWTLLCIGIMWIIEIVGGADDSRITTRMFCILRENQMRWAIAMERPIEAEKQIRLKAHQGARQKGNECVTIRGLSRFISPCVITFRIRWKHSLYFLCGYSNDQKFIESWVTCGLFGFYFFVFALIKRAMNAITRIVIVMPSIIR